MKNLFVINPVAGKGDNLTRLTAEIHSLMSGRGDYEIYATKGPLDAENKVKTEASSGEELRVYACGGDGTFNECVNGAASFENAAVSCFACGSGNDFVRMFGNDAPLFSSLPALINGSVRNIDIISVAGRYCANIASLGFDARVGTDVHKYTRGFISGGFAYIVSLVVNLIKGINKPLRLKVNGETLDGEFALVCACNGQYYGGGFNPVPDAEPDDGFIDLLAVSKVSRARFLALVGKYAKGRYAEMTEVIRHFRCREAEFQSPETIPVNVDGECVMTAASSFRIVPGGLRLIVPEGAEYFSSRS